MESRTKKQLKSGAAYDALFPKAGGATVTIKKGATVGDTVQFIPKAVQLTLAQTAKIAQVLKGNDLYATCSNIWHFLYGHIAYQKDEAGHEQIRSPSRSWRDRHSGIDCDCFSVFISSILSNLGIKHLLRITKYSQDYFQHIYPVVPYANGYIIMDCVTDRFDYEVPYSEKKDFTMDLQFLNGFEGGMTGSMGTHGQGVDGMTELGRLLQKKFGKTNKGLPPGKKIMPGFAKKAYRKVQQAKATNLRTAQTPALPAANPAPAVPDGYALPRTKKKKFGGKLLNVVNKVNPATVLLRNGILASMKLNTRNVAARLRWSYLTPQQAADKGIEPAKFQKLVAARMRLEKVFYGAGGKPANLRKAIMSGKGNKDKAVNGLEGWNGSMGELVYLNEYTPLSSLLGPEIFYDENINGLNGAGTLGEPITLSSIAAAAGVIAGIVGMLKDVGNIFKKKDTKGADDFDEKVNQAADKAAPVPAANIPAEKNETPAAAQLPQNKEADPAPHEEKMVYDSPAVKKEQADNEMPEQQNKTANTENTAAEKTPEDNPGFWEKNKGWLKPVAIGAGSLTLLAIGYSMVKGNKAAAPQPDRSTRSLNGPPGKRKYKNHHRNKAKTKYPKKHPVSLF
jgi:hypothetical protein